MSCAIAAVGYPPKADPSMFLRFLFAPRDQFPGKQFHGAPDGCVIDQAALIEVRNELFYGEFLSESIDPADAVVRVAEDSDVSINPIIGDLLDPFLQLLVGLVTSDGVGSQRLDQFTCHTKKCI